MEMKAVTVSQLNEYIGRVLSSDPLLSGVRVKGELTYVKYHSSGHVYFTLSDAQSRLSCFLPSDRVGLLERPLAEGDEVTLGGYIRVYQKGGYYSLNTKSVEYDGSGALADAFEKLKVKLAKEGLFAEEHKKPIPRSPGRIGLVTAETGAAVRDMIKIITSRTVLTDIIVFPVAVQGVDAAEDIAAMIDYIDDKWYGRLDTVIVGRGGGAPEELYAFNDEGVARAIYKCRIPVISAVGHEIDFSISDFVADARAETPTAAAQMAVSEDAATLAEAADMLDDIVSRTSSVMMYETLQVRNAYHEILRYFAERVESEIASADIAFSDIKGNDPLRIIGRGYAAVTDSGGKPLRSADEVSIGDGIRIRLKDGELDATVDGVRK